MTECITHRNVTTTAAAAVEVPLWFPPLHVIIEVEALTGTYKLNYIDSCEPKVLG